MAILCNVKRTTTQSNAVNEKELAAILTRNPDLRIIDDGAGHVHKMPIRTRGEELAVAFEQLWRLLDGPALEKEHRFDKRRRWRFDYAHIATRIAVEINGGVWSQGRHNRGRGYLNDLDKLNAAQASGWRVFQLGTGQVTIERVQAIIDTIREAEAAE